MQQQNDAREKYCNQKLGKSQNLQTLKKNVKEKCYKYKNTQSPKTTARTWQIEHKGSAC